MILLLTILLSLSSPEVSVAGEVPSFVQSNLDLSESLQNSQSPTDRSTELHEKIQTALHNISARAVYFGAGTTLGATSLLARLGWGICQIIPSGTALGKEFLLLSHLCGTTAKHAFAQMLNEESPPPYFFYGVPLSQYSWYLNQSLLSQIPVASFEGKKLLLFLEKRWLAKSAGFYASMIDWAYPCFGISVQVHPETSHTYARDPCMQRSPTYINIVEAWKQLLPHPQQFPLILTRPFDLRDYLPCYLRVAKGEKIETTVERIALKNLSEAAKVLVDVTSIFSDEANDQKKWLEIWDSYQEQFSRACKERNVNLDQILCIQTVKQEEIGGVRLLPLPSLSLEEIELDHHHLLEWVSMFGLSANRIELDRSTLLSHALVPSRNVPALAQTLPSKERFLSCVIDFEKKWSSNHPQKNLMIQGTIQLLKGLLADLSEDKWQEIRSCPTRSAIAELSFLQIKEQFEFLRKDEEERLFFDTASSIEQIHASLSALLEIFAPFTSQDFSLIYRDFLKSIPAHLKSLLMCGVHSSGMTSFAGVLKAVEKSVGKVPRVLYGENSYFENNNAAQLVSHLLPINEATEEDWKEVDLLLAQFNPALKRFSLTRVDSKVTEYRVEKVAETLHKTLNVRKGKPLTVLLDCTLDLIDSPRMGRLLTEFQEEIEKGILNVIYYRSGLKFDLFGMDNYCGSPFYMIHSRDSQWACFDSLLSDPVLQTDNLSLNWFCLAYKHAASQLELYQRQIFHNTRALLNKIPSRILKSQNSVYRIVPVEAGADPAFIDIKILGSLHQIRAAALVAGILSVKCLEGGHPLFYRQSLGFYHPNFFVLFDKDFTTIRLTLGLDPAQVDLIAECFETINALHDDSSL